MSEQTFDSNERLAIWEAHGKVCMYGKEPLSLDNYHVDHIIPEKTNPDELEKLKVLYKLPADFDVGAYYNHVPSCEPCNRKKGTKATGSVEFFIALALDAAKSKAPEIEKRVRTLATENMYNSIQRRVAAGIENGTFTMVELDKLYEFGEARLSLLTFSATSITPLVSPSSTSTVPIFPSSSPATTTMTATYPPARTSKHRKGRT